MHTRYLVTCLLPTLTNSTQSSLPPCRPTGTTSKSLKAFWWHTLLPTTTRYVYSCSVLTPYAIVLIYFLKIDLKEVARLYGNGMTYDALESHSRVWKRQARDLKAAAMDNTLPTPKKPRANSSSPTKKTSRSPSKKSKYYILGVIALLTVE